VLHQQILFPHVVRSTFKLQYQTGVLQVNDLVDEDSDIFFRLRLFIPTTEEDEFFSTTLPALHEEWKARSDPSAVLQGALPEDVIGDGLAEVD
jgi:hypothetical protein